jgi:hypothetical protein
MVSMPGHTPYQAAVIVEEEGVVVFTSDNVFCKMHTWLQEADRHGPVCDKRYLDEQEASIEEWVDYVRRAIERGMTKEQCVATLTAMTDRYPMDVEQDGMAPRVMQMNVANLYDYLTGAGIDQHH